MSQNTVETYTGLIASQHQKKPKYVATVSISAAVYVQLQTVLNSMIALFDLSQQLVGDQLDIIGQWVGVSRQIANPFSGIFFSWDGDVANGWDAGIWQDPNAPTAIVTLPDDVYQTLILAKIAANSWDGTTEGAYAIWEQLFPQYTLLIQDNENMSFAIGIQGAVPDSLTLALITGGYIPLKPEGIRISEYFIPVNTGPLFAWDIETDAAQGWDQGSWTTEIISSS